MNEPSTPQELWPFMSPRELGEACVRWGRLARKCLTSDSIPFLCDLAGLSVDIALTSDSMCNHIDVKPLMQLKSRIDKAIETPIPADPEEDSWRFALMDCFRRVAQVQAWAALTIDKLGEHPRDVNGGCPADPTDLISQVDAADAAKVSTRTIARWIKAGELPAHGTARRVRESDVVRIAPRLIKRKHQRSTK